MCGIAGFHVKDPKVIRKHEGVELLVDELLKGIEHRGKHATGFVSVGFDGTVQLDKAAKEASEFIKDRERIPEGVRTVLLHTRYATQGPKENTENNHPVVFGTCFATHNGHIHNDTEVFTDLDLTRTAAVDSIAIAASASYEGISETEDIRTALERLQGPMACAIIDPIKNPGKLILAKGASSPLYVVDTPKFLVWASTIETITKAWAKVLGTPPNAKKIENITEGNFIIVNDTEVTREKFTVNRRPYVPPTRPVSQTRTTGNTHGRSGGGFGFRAKETTPTEAHPVTQAREAIAEFIKAGGTARNFDDHQNGLYNDDDFKDVVGDRKWHPCFSCNRLVLGEDMVKSEWGGICCDCYTATKRELARAEQEMQDTEDDVCAGTTVPRIGSADRDSLEVWADHELRIHKDVLEEMTKALGSYYSPQAIEFLCFFTTPEYRDVAGDAVNNLITELRELYELSYVDIVSSTWESVEGDVCEVPNNHPLLLEAGESSKLDQWRFCYAHNRPYKTAESCNLCAEEDAMEGEARLAAMLDHGSEDESSEEATSTDAETGIYLPFERGRDSVITRSERSYTRSSGGATEGEDGNGSNDSGGEVIDLPRCGHCGTYVLRATEESCTVCRESEKDDTGDAQAVCTSCQSHRPKFIVGYNGKNYYYCRQCYNECPKLVHEEDNTFHLCKVKTNHTLKDGVRVCHQHARSQSETLSDTTLRKRGATITEV